jgi:hypothetical protein
VSLASNASCSSKHSRSVAAFAHASGTDFDSRNGDSDDWEDDADSGASDCASDGDSVFGDSDGDSVFGDSDGCAETGDTIGDEADEASDGGFIGTNETFDPAGSSMRDAGGRELGPSACEDRPSALSATTDGFSDIRSWPV